MSFYKAGLMDDDYPGLWVCPHCDGTIHAFAGEGPPLLRDPAVEDALCEKFEAEYRAAFDLFQRAAVTREKGDPEIARRFAVVDAWLDALHLVRGEEASEYTLPSAVLSLAGPGQEPA